MSNDQPKSLQLWHPLGYAGVLVYVLSLAISFWLNFPIPSGVFHVAERFGNLIFSTHTWLVESGLGGILNVADQVAQVCGYLGPLVAIPILSISGIRLLAVDTNRRRGFLLLVIGILTTVIASAVPILVSTFYSNGLARIRAEGASHVASIRRQLGRKDLSPKTRELAWKVYASDVYFNTGQIVPIPGESGGTVGYEPTRADRLSREQMLEVESQLRHPFGHLVLWGSYLLLSILVAVSLGFLPKSGRPNERLAT